MTDLPPAAVTGEQREAFQNVRRPGPPRRTDKDKVRALLDQIGAKRAAGWSYAEIHQALAETVGFQGTRQTLYNYVWELSSRKRAAGEPRRRRSVRNPLEDASPVGDDRLKGQTLVERLNEPL